MLGLATSLCCRTAGDEQPARHKAMTLKLAMKRLRRAVGFLWIECLVSIPCMYKRTDEKIYSLQK